MQQAIKEALKADPNHVYPNPLVGCIIVKDNKFNKGFEVGIAAKDLLNLN